MSKIVVKDSRLYVGVAKTIVTIVSDGDSNVLTTQNCLFSISFDVYDYAKHLSWPVVMM